MSRDIFYNKPIFPKKKISKLKINNLNELSIEDINKLTLNECILELPITLRNKIGIYCIKLFWKNHTLEKSLIPIWHKHQTYVKNLFNNSIRRNIHFMHLDFNTLPENKKYILGCQCDYCKYYVENNIDIFLYHIMRQIIDESYFDKFVHESTSSNWNLENVKIYDKNHDFLYSKPIFNSLYDLYLLNDL